MVKHFTSYASEETVKLYQGTSATGTPLVNYRGTSSDGNTEKTWEVCLGNGDYYFEFIDSYGDGWGSSTNPAYVYVQVGGITVYKGGLPYQSGTSLKNGSGTFNLNPALSFTSTWTLLLLVVGTLPPSTITPGSLPTPMLCLLSLL